MRAGLVLRRDEVRGRALRAHHGDRPDVDLAVTSLRMFNVFGPRQSISNPYQGVLAIFIGNVLRGEPITIHGDGEQTRDFVYVDDVVDAWMRVLDAPDAFGAVLNVGSGRETSVNELADAVLDAFGESRSTWDVRFEDVQLGDQRRAAADTPRVERLGWNELDRLDDGMAQRWRGRGEDALGAEWARRVEHVDRERLGAAAADGQRSGAGASSGEMYIARLAGSDASSSDTLIARRAKGSGGDDQRPALAARNRRRLAAR